VLPTHDLWSPRDSRMINGQQAGPPSRFDTDKGATLSTWMNYVLCGAQQKAGALGYSPLPKNLVVGGFRQIDHVPGHVPTPDLKQLPGATTRRTRTVSITSSPTLPCRHNATRRPLPSTALRAIPTAVPRPLRRPRARPRTTRVATRRMAAPGRPRTRGRAQVDRRVQGRRRQRQAPTRARLPPGRPPHVVIGVPRSRDRADRESGVDPISHRRRECRTGGAAATRRRNRAPR